MSHYGNLSDWSDEADKRLGQHYLNIGLRFPYRRTRAQAAIDGMMEVASELIDSGVIEGKYDDSVFMTKDFRKYGFMKMLNLVLYNGLHQNNHLPQKKDGRINAQNLPD